MAHADQADDIAAEVWVEVAALCPNFVGGDDAFRAWVFTLARRRLIDTYRRAGRRPTERLVGDVHQVAGDGPEDETVARLSLEETVVRLRQLLPPHQVEVLLLRVVGDFAGVTAIALTTATTAADTAVGAGAGFTVGDNSFDAGFVQVLQSALDSQFVGVDVAVVRGRLVLEGYASPGVHTAVVNIIANLLQTPLPLPVALAIVSPNLGLALPFIAAGAGIELPDLSGLLELLGVVDRIRVAR